MGKKGKHIKLGMETNKKTHFFLSEQTTNFFTLCVSHFIKYFTKTYLNLNIFSIFYLNCMYFFEFCFVHFNADVSEMGHIKIIFKYVKSIYLQIFFPRFFAKLINFSSPFLFLLINVFTTLVFFICHVES